MFTSSVLSQMWEFILTQMLFLTSIPLSEAAQTYSKTHHPNYLRAFSAPTRGSKEPLKGEECLRLQQRLGIQSLINELIYAFMLFL